MAYFMTSVHILGLCSMTSRKLRSLAVSTREKRIGYLLLSTAMKASIRPPQMLVNIFVDASLLRLMMAGLSIAGSMNTMAALLQP